MSFSPVQYEMPCTTPYDVQVSLYKAKVKLSACITKSERESQKETLKISLYLSPTRSFKYMYTKVFMTNGYK